MAFGQPSLPKLDAALRDLLAGETSQPTSRSWLKPKSKPTPTPSTTPPSAPRQQRQHPPPNPQRSALVASGAGLDGTSKPYLKPTPKPNSKPTPTHPLNSRQQHRQSPPRSSPVVSLPDPHATPKPYLQPKPKPTSNSLGQFTAPRQRQRSPSPNPPSGALIGHLLEVLNECGPPKLDKFQLTAIFHAVRGREFGRGAAGALTFEELDALKEPLGEAILKAKLARTQPQPVLSASAAQSWESVPASPADTMMADGTPTLDQFLAELQRIICEQNGAQLQDYLVIEPPYRQLYTAMIAEIRQRYPKGKEDELEGKCSAALPEAREGADGSPWTAFIKFITQYFAFIRDVNVENLLETYNQLSELVQKCNSALSHPSLGIVILPTVIAYSRVLARLAIGLDKRPELIAHLTKQSPDDSGVRETLPERAANILRQAFVTCLNDRTGTASGVRDGKPDGKKVGIYTIANLCLKILFQCRKTRNAEQIFSNIYNQSPPLSIYPRPERITYLYYLGRFLFSNNHFYRAQHALQAAYDQCPPHRLKQRRLILIYLVASNIILGRFPSAALYSQPEALGFAERFAPLCRSIARGDLATFRRLTDPKNEHASWFLHYRIFLQLRNRCEVLVWRSLIRKTFVLAGQQGDAQARKAPTLDLGYVLQLAQMLEQKALSPLSQLDGGPGRRHTNWIFMDREPPASARYVDPDFAGTEEGRPEVLLPDMLEVESIVASLVDQGLLNGFISHRQLRFAIQGAKRKGALPAGFPNVWEIFKGRCDEEVPGWKKDPPRGAVSATAGRIAAGGFGPGMVVNLSGARPVGAVP